MALNDRLDGRHALVTGGSKGAGAAIVARLGDAGATVMTVARTMPPGYPSPELFVETDLSTPAGAATVIARVKERLGTIQILVHALGGSHAASGGYQVLSDHDWNDELSLNLLSAVRLDRGLLPAMAERSEGTVVHVTSIQRRMPLLDATLGYAAAKAAPRRGGASRGLEVGLLSVGEGGEDIAPAVERAQDLGDGVGVGGVVRPVDRGEGQRHQYERGSPSTCSER